MEHRVLQQVHQHLLDQHGVHGDHNKVLRQLQLHRNVRAALFEFDQHRVQQLFQHGGGLFDRHLFPVEAGHGKQILHHTVEPLGILAGLPQQLEGLFLAQRIVVFRHGGAGPVNGGEGRAQVVGDRPQKVGAHFFPLGLHAQLLLFFDPGGQGTGHDGYGQHHKAGEQIFRQGKIEGKIGGEKGKIDRQHTCQRGQHAPEITVGVHGGDKHSQHEDQHGHAVDAAGDALHPYHRHPGDAQCGKHDQKVAVPGTFFHKRFTPPDFILS